MLWRNIFSNFECKLHNVLAIKEFPKHILQCRFDFSISFLQYIYGWIWSIINDFIISFTIHFCWKINVIYKCVLCNFFENRVIYSTDVYINTIINYQEDSHSTHFSLSMGNMGEMVITDDTNSHFSNSVMCVSFSLLGVNYLYNSNLSIFPLFSG